MLIITIITVFIKRKLLSVETILSVPTVFVLFLSRGDRWRHLGLVPTLNASLPDILLSGLSPVCGRCCFVRQSRCSVISFGSRMFGSMDLQQSLEMEIELRACLGFTV